MHAEGSSAEILPGMLMLCWVQIKDNKDGTYLAIYRAIRAGQYQLHVLFGRFPASLYWSKEHCL